MYKKQYSIHGLVNIKVVSRSLRHLKYLNRKYSYFFAENLNSFDIEVAIAPFEFNEDANAVKKDAYYIGNGNIFWNNRRKLARWNVFVGGLENKSLKILFWGNSISLKYLCMHILEPLINIKLATKGFVMLHGSAIQAEGKTYVFCSKPGIGKTSLAMYLVKKARANFLSDEFVILSRKAEVYNFAMPIALYDYNIAKMPHLYSQLPPRETMVLKVKKIIRQLTNNWIKMPTYIDLKKFYPACKFVTKDELKRLYVINMTTEKELFLGQMDIDEAINEIMEINSYQFRFFYDALNAYLSEKPQSRLKTIYATQKEILLDALRGKKFSKMFISDVLDLDEKNIAEILA